MSVEQSVCNLIGDVLSLGLRTRELNRATELLGALPELDSMAVASLLTAIEEHFDILIEDDEISAEIFIDVGSLSDFIEGKINGK